jgi:hypothetical protein
MMRAEYAGRIERWEKWNDLFLVPQAAELIALGTKRGRVLLTRGYGYFCGPSDMEVVVP